MYGQLYFHFLFDYLCLYSWKATVLSHAILIWILRVVDNDILIKWFNFSTFPCMFVQCLDMADILAPWPGPVFCLLLGVSSDYVQPITGQVTEVTCPVIGRAQPELSPSKRQRTGPDLVTAMSSWFLQLAHWYPNQNVTNFTDNIVKCICLNKNVCILIKL